jgi:hemerythrin-like domain-containing protein
MSRKPLKRHEGLQPLSREHHQGLIIALNVHKGVQKAVEFHRMVKYIRFQFEELLQPHFQFEEEKVFPLLPQSDELRQQAEQQHLKIKSIVAQLKSNDDCGLFADLLRDHIRFEERELFEAIQAITDMEHLNALIGQWEENVTCVNWEDPFWK